MKYLQSDPDIASGDLTIKGTRIRISDVFRMLAAGMSIEYLTTTRWPWMARMQLEGAIDEAISQLEPSHAHV